MIDDDPVLEAYLAFLERDMAAHPEQIRPLSADGLTRARRLVGHIEVDLDEDLGDIDLHSGIPAPDPATLAKENRSAQTDQQDRPRPDAR